MATNLPSKTIQDSAAGTKLFFDSYGSVPVEFASTDIDAVIGYFTEKGFAKESAITSGIVLLKQAKLDGRPIFEILDSLKGFSDLQLSALVATILNNNRKPSSVLGFKNGSIARLDQTRNTGA